MYGGITHLDIICISIYKYAAPEAWGQEIPQEQNYLLFWTNKDKDSNSLWRHLETSLPEAISLHFRAISLGISSSPPQKHLLLFQGNPSNVCLCTGWGRRGGQVSQKFLCNIVFQPCGFYPVTFWHCKNSYQLQLITSPCGNCDSRNQGL